MAAGDLITLDYQYEYRGLLFGHQTELMVLNVDGLFSTPDVKSEDHERTDTHGEFDAPLLMGPRYIEVTLRMRRGPINAEVLHQELATAFLPTQDSHRFVFSRPGMPTRFVSCRVHDRVIPSTYELARGMAEVNVMLKATDPVIYGLVEKVTTFTSSSSMNHGGNWPMAPVLEVIGPASNPRIEHVQQDRMIAIGGPFDVMDVPLNSTLIVDVKNKLVTMDGSDYYSKVRVDNRWWLLEPGTNTIAIHNSSGTTSALDPGGSINVRHRDAWM